jgi:hypothetical protein
MNVCLASAAGNWFKSSNIIFISLTLLPIYLKQRHFS